MPFRHTVTRIREIVKAPKALVTGQSVSSKKHGSHGLSFDAFVVFLRCGRSENCRFFQQSSCKNTQTGNDLLTFETWCCN
jgi:hypothetical protein